VALRGLVAIRTQGWPPHSRLFALGDRGGWSVDEDAEHVAGAARRLGYAVGPEEWAPFVGRQAVFVTSHFEALAPRWLSSPHRLGLAYMHGRPGTAGAPEFDRAFEALRTNAARIARVQVTHEEMEALVLSAGVEPSRVFRIPLGIDLDLFPLGDGRACGAARQALGLPADAFVAGSFQKDGVGWADGLEPKLVKGPDVLVAALVRLHELRPELHVLLTGPARGYVLRELQRLAIPFRHVLLRSREELALAYHALDVYIVASRQEGGPKAVLEAMATGVPIVSTRVGQAASLIRHGINGWLADVEDAEALAELAAGAGREPAVLAAARATAEELALERLDAQWAALFDGFVEQA
jgi:glycosyltransferase involved in cell wall biosynthesis